MTSEKVPEPTDEGKRALRPETLSVLRALADMQGTDGWARAKFRGQYHDRAKLGSGPTAHSRWVRHTGALLRLQAIEVEPVEASVGRPAAYRVTDSGKALLSAPTRSEPTGSDRVTDRVPTSSGCLSLSSSVSRTNEKKEENPEPVGSPKPTGCRPGPTGSEPTGCNGTGHVVVTVPSDPTAAADFYRGLADLVERTAGVARPAPALVSCEPAPVAHMVAAAPVHAPAARQGEAYAAVTQMLEILSNAGIGMVGHPGKAREHLTAALSRPDAPSLDTLYAAWQRDCTRWAAMSPDESKFRKHIDTWIRDRDWERAHVESDADRAERERAAREASRAARAAAERKREQDEARARQEKDRQLGERFAETLAEARRMRAQA